MQHRILLSFGFLLLLGCTSGAVAPPTYRVEGVVTYDGSPVEGATVIFYPTDPKCLSASGVTDPGGNFEVTTYVSQGLDARGAMAGEYKITVTKLDSSSTAPPPTTGLPTPEQMISSTKLKMTAPESLLPEIYSKPTTSGLEVKVGESNEPLLLQLRD